MNVGGSENGCRHEYVQVYECKNEENVVEMVRGKEIN